MNQPMQKFIEDLRNAFHSEDKDSSEKSAEAKNVEQLQEISRRIVSDDFDGALALMTEDVVLEISGPVGFIFSGRWEGKEKVKGAIINNLSMVAQRQPRVLSVVAQGDAVVVVAHEAGVVCSTNKSYSANWMQMFTFRDSLVAKILKLADSNSMNNASS